MKKRIAHTTSAKLRMIQAAFDLFHERGVHATSIDSILERSGTGKSQFTHYFRNKEGLVHAVLQHFYDLLRSGGLPFKQTLESWKDVEESFRFFIETQRAMGCARGCPIGTIGNDLIGSQRRLRRDVGLIFDLTRTSLARFFAAEQARGAIRASIDPEALADFCFSITQGGLLVAKIKRQSVPFENAVMHALAYLQSLRTSPRQRRRSTGTARSGMTSGRVKAAGNSIDGRAAQRGRAQPPHRALAVDRRRLLGLE